MKILVSGKGGSGKSTLCVRLAQGFKAKGYQVLLVDGDESNYGLHRMAGVEFPTQIMESLGGKKGFKEKINKPFPNTDKPFSKPTTITQLPKECVAEADGIRLAVIGKIHHFGEGCACPMGMLSRMMLSSLEVGENEVIIIDTEAGIEHFGRRVDAECDLIIGVIDPTYESLILSQKLEDMAQKANKPIYFVLNKTNEQVLPAMMKNLDAEKVAACLPYREEIFMQSLEGRPLEGGLGEIAVVIDKILEMEK